MSFKEIRTNNSPLPVGPYSQAVEANNTIFVSGILPLDLSTKKLVSGEIAESARCILNHLDNILKEAGLKRANVIKSTIFLKDLANFADINKVYAEFFSDLKTLPARSTVEVARLPLDAPVEMDFIAIRWTVR